jgi:3-methylfumaryl-CoA hydratase
MSTDVHQVTELITPGPAQALAGLLGVACPDEELPLLWHWVYLLDRPPQATLGPDGHQARGGMPVPPGPLHFVTVRTEVSQGSQVAITEEQDVVYRERGANSPARSGHSVAMAGRDWPVTVDPVLLFRFSALTYNAHRIHYDREYARAEGYPGLVVHGPLQALLMAELASSRGPAGSEFSYRLVAPLYEDEGLIVSAAADGDAVRVSCRDATDRITATGVIR